MKRFVFTILLTTFMLLCVGALVIMAIGLNETRNELTYKQKRHSDLSQRKKQIKQDLLGKDEYLEKLLSDPVFLDRVVRERLGWSNPEEWIFRFPQEEETGD